MKLIDDAGREIELPFVGPVTRHANGSLMIGGAFWAGAEGTAEGQRYDAAEHLVVAAFLNAEAEAANQADESGEVTDAEVEAVQAYLQNESYVLNGDTVAGIIRAAAKARNA